MCEGGCTGSSPCESCVLDIPSLTVAILSNKPNVDDIVPDSTITVDGHQMEVHNYINTYHLNKSGHFDHGVSSRLKLSELKVNGNPLSIVHELKNAYREKTGKDVSIHDSIKLQHECRGLVGLNNLVASHVSMTRSDIAAHLKHLGDVMNMKSIIRAVIHSTTLNISVAVDIPHLLSPSILTLYGKIRLIQQNIRAAIYPVFSKFSRAKQDRRGLNLVILGDLELLKSDIEGASATLIPDDLKASLATELSSITILKNGYGLPANSKYQYITYGYVDQVNAVIQSAGSLNGLLGLSLGEFSLACVTNHLLSLLRKAGLCKFHFQNLLVAIGASKPDGRADTPTGNTDQQNAAYGSTGGEVAGYGLCVGAAVATDTEEAIEELCPEAGAAGAMGGTIVGANMNNIVSGASHPDTYVNTTVAVVTTPPEVPAQLSSVCGSISEAFSNPPPPPSLPNWPW